MRFGEMLFSSNPALACGLASLCCPIETSRRKLQCFSSPINCLGSAPRINAVVWDLPPLNKNYNHPLPSKDSGSYRVCWLQQIRALVCHSPLWSPVPKKTAPKVVASLSSEKKVQTGDAEGGREGDKFVNSLHRQK